MKRKVKWGIKGQRNKIIAMLLSIALAGTLLTGCGKETQTMEESLGETTEVFNIYMMSPSGVLRGDGQGYLHFYDRESGQTAYLCSQTGCLHQDANCGAYINGLYCAFYYDDNLYYIRFTVDENDRAIYQLLRANRYGEERQQLAEFSPLPFPPDIKQYEGKLYFFGSDWDYEEDKAEGGLFTVDLESGEFMQIDHVEGYNIDYPLMSFSGQYYLTDRYLYRIYTSSNMDLNEFYDQETGAFLPINWDELVTTWLLYRTDRETGESELLIEEVEDSDEFVMMDIIEADGEEMIVRLYNRIIRYENGEEAEVLYEYTGEDILWTITRLGDEYLVCENKPENRFHILRDWEEADSFSALEEWCGCYGKAGNTIYFNTNSGLYAMDYEAFLNGSYELEHIDL